MQGDNLSQPSDPSADSPAASDAAPIERQSVRSRRWLFASLAILIFTPAAYYVCLPRRPVATIELPTPIAVLVQPYGSEILALSTPQRTSMLTNKNSMLESYSLPGLARLRKIGDIETSGMQIAIKLSGGLLACRDWTGTRFLDPESLQERWRIPAYHKYLIAQYVFSADGRWMAARTDSVVRRESQSLGILLWDISAQPAERAMFLDTGISEIAFSADSKWLIYSTRTDVKLIDIQTRQVVSLNPLQPREGIHAIGVQERGDLVALATSSSEIQLWHARDRRMVRRFKFKNLHFIPRGPTAFVANDSVLVVMAMRNGQSARLARTPPFLHFVPWLRMELVAIDAQTGAENWSHPTSKNVDAISAIPDSNRFLVRIDGRIEIWNAR